eukprot:m.462510 g.462510  ORF g.462510 m.462510 type:complete len:249 (-) comp21603_c0_seq20:845-1591(-)
MGNGERSDLLPGRIQSDTREITERILAGILSIIVFSAIITAVILGFKNSHPEHIFMAFILAMSFTQFVMIARLYLKDIMQDHVVLYFSGLTTMLVATGTLIYATEWTIIPPTPQELALESCVAANSTSTCYNENIKSGSKSGCISFSQNLFNAYTPGANCMVFNNQSSTWARLFQNKNITAADCITAVSRCGLKANASLTTCANSGRPPSTAKYAVSAPQDSYTTQPMTTTDTGQSSTNASPQEASLT